MLIILSVIFWANVDKPWLKFLSGDLEMLCPTPVAFSFLKNCLLLLTPL